MMLNECPADYPANSSQMHIYVEDADVAYASAMRLGAKDADAYLAEWRKAEPYQVEGDAAEVAEAEAARLEEEFDRERVRKLIANNGWA